MFANKAILALFIIGVLLAAGCTSTTQTNKGTTPATTGGTPSGSTGTQSGSGDSGSGSATSGSGTNSGSGTGSGTSGSGSSGGSNDLLGKTYEQLLGLGVPMQCDISTTYEGKTTTAKIYMKGEGEVRSEMDISQSDSTCKRMVTIGKGEKFYVGCSEGALFPDTGDAASNPFSGCAWLEMTVNKSSTTGSSTYSAPDYTDTPASQINCLPWVYDPSKFVVSGKTCDLDQIMKDLTQNMPSGYN